MENVAVMQVTDTLQAGGLERVAVNLANSLAERNFRSHLCITRSAGPLASSLSEKVRSISLNRKGRLDLIALCRLANYTRKNEIRIIHAHGTSLFIASALSLLCPSVRLVWHDHFGRLEVEERSSTLYRLAASRAAGVISVSEPLACWAREKLGVRPERVWYVSNFASFASADGDVIELPGERGKRVVCVANFRPEKNHLNLLHAFVRVVQKMPEAHLILVGAVHDAAYQRKIEQAVTNFNLSRAVSFLGSRTDVPAILNKCDVGVLGSSSEGLPLALIEYGMAGLPVVATNVGQCADVLDQGRAGLLVPAGSSETLAHAIILLLRSAKMRKEMASNFSARVARFYSADSSLRKICEIYDTIIESGPGRGK